MNKIFYKIVAVVIVITMLSGCVSRKPKEETQQEQETPQSEQTEQPQEETEQPQEEKDEEDEGEAPQYKIRETGFGIKMLDGWKISSLPEPMGLIVEKNNDMNNAAMISIMYGDEKAQMEKDFEGNFTAIEKDKEIQNYFCDQTKVGDFYRIVLDYESFSEETNQSVLTKVVYQETQGDGLIIASFQYLPEQKAEIKAISESIQPLKSGEILLPEEIEQLG